MWNNWQLTKLQDWYHDQQGLQIQERKEKYF
jgi:hypothetical protein